MSKIIFGVIASFVMFFAVVSTADAAPGGKIDLSDSRVIACSIANTSGGTDYWACLHESQG